MAKVYLTLKIDVKDTEKLMNASKSLIRQNGAGETENPEWEPEDEGDAIYEVLYGKVLKDEETYGINVAASSIAIVENDQDEELYDNDLLGISEVEEIEE